MKVCAKCRNEKSDSCFGVDKRNGSLNSWCRVCNKDNCRKYYYEKVKPIKYPEKPKAKTGHRFCSQCKKELRDECFYREKSNICKPCENSRQMKRYWEKRDEIREKRREYHEKNKEYRNARAKKMRAINNHSKYSAEKAKQYREEIRDSYIKLRLRNKGYKNEDITQEMIEAFKVEVVMDRIKKNLEKLGVKVCDICKKQKPLNEYYTKGYVWGGEKKRQISNVCIPCSKERSKSYKNNRKRKKK